MSGTKEGGLKAAKTNVERFGDKYYSEIGKKGGMRGHTGGFAANRELARIAGSMGGRKSKRGKNLQEKLEKYEDEIQALIDSGESVHAIAAKFGVSDGTMKRFALDSGMILPTYVENY